MVYSTTSILLQTVDGTFGGSLNVLVHNASTAYFPAGDTGNAYDKVEELSRVAWKPGMLTKGKLKL